MFFSDSRSNILCCISCQASWMAGWRFGFLKIPYLAGLVFSFLSKGGGEVFYTEGMEGPGWTC